MAFVPISHDLVKSGKSVTKRNSKYKFNIWIRNLGCMYGKTVTVSFTTLETTKEWTGIKKSFKLSKALICSFKTTQPL